MKCSQPPETCIGTNGTNVGSNGCNKGNKNGCNGNNGTNDNGTNGYNNDTNVVSLDSSVCYGFSGSINNSASVNILLPAKRLTNNVTDGRYPEGTSVQYTCNKGYSPIGGNSQVECTSDGSWLPSPPSCARKNNSNLYLFISLLCYYCVIVSCPFFSIPNNDTKETTIGTEPGTTVHVTCKKGFELIGTEELTCQVNGTWSTKIPRCSTG